MGWLDTFDPDDSVSERYHAARDAVQELVNQAQGAWLTLYYGSGRDKLLKPYIDRFDRLRDQWHSVDDNNTFDRLAIATDMENLKVDFVAFLTEKGITQAQSVADVAAGKTPIANSPAESGKQAIADAEKKLEDAGTSIGFGIGVAAFAVAVGLYAIYGPRGKK